MLVRAGHQVIAVDASRSMLSILRARLAQERPGVRKRVRVVAADVTRLALSRVITSWQSIIAELLLAGPPARHRARS